MRAIAACEGLVSADSISERKFPRREERAVGSEIAGAGPRGSLDVVEFEQLAGDSRLVC